MKFFLFHKPSGGQPDFIRAFNTEKKLNRYIEEDLEHLRATYPKEKWRITDYMIAERVKRK